MPHILGQNTKYFKAMSCEGDWKIQCLPQSWLALPQAAQCSRLSSHSVYVVCHAVADRVQCTRLQAKER